MTNRNQLTSEPRDAAPVSGRIEKVVSFSKQPSVILQEDIEEAFVCRVYAEEALNARDYERAERALSRRSQLLKDIEAAIRAGATVEGGAHTAKLVVDPSACYIKLEIL